MFKIPSCKMAHLSKGQIRLKRLDIVGLYKPDINITDNTGFDRWSWSSRAASLYSARPEPYPFDRAGVVGSGR